MAILRVLALSAAATGWKAVVGVIEADGPVAVCTAISTNARFLSHVVSSGHDSLLPVTASPTLGLQRAQPWATTGAHPRGHRHAPTRTYFIVCPAPNNPCSQALASAGLAVGGALSQLPAGRCEQLLNDLVRRKGESVLHVLSASFRGHPPSPSTRSTSLRQRSRSERRDVSPEERSPAHAR